MISSKDILLRLPAKSIERFKCVSKSWQSLLHSYLFFKRHLEFDDHILFFDSSLYPHLITLTSQKGNDGVSRKLGLPHLESKRHVFVSGSCHGLLLISQDSRDFRGVVVNPVTLEAIQIPKIGPNYNITESMYGLGYDNSRNDFKIVSINCRDQVYMYSLRYKNWRSLGKTSPFEYHNTCEGAFVGGCLHWVSRMKEKNETFIIASFNLVTEEFETLPYPQGVEYLDCGFRNEVIVLGGCLALVIGSCGGSFRSSINVWLMKEYGVQDSWMGFRIHVPEDVGCRRSIVKFLNENELVLVENFDKFVAYDWRNRVWRDMGLGGTPKSMSKLILLLVNKINI